MNIETKVMRDVFIEEISVRMDKDKSLFFVSADFGSPKLDHIREHHKDRFINVGIAEQNLVNICTGLALEGFTVYAYSIAPFLTMRAYEQIRIDLSLHAQVTDINVNLIGVGAGLSYDVSGPTHHCVEDLTIMRVLPNVEVFSPSDWMTAKKFVEYSIKVNRPKYIRFDGKPLPRIYENADDIDFGRGFWEIVHGNRVCLVSTGYMTHKALKVAHRLAQEGTNIGVIDIFMLKPMDEDGIFKTLNNYEHVITLEEGFINKGGLDSLISSIIENRNAKIRLQRRGFNDAYVFDIGSREYLHNLKALGEEDIINDVKIMVKV